MKGKTEMPINKEVMNKKIVRDMAEYREVFWLNPDVRASCPDDLPYGMSDIEDAEERLRRFAPYISKQFPETKPQGGLIESPLREIPKMKEVLERSGDQGRIDGRLFLKCDSHLAISGSVKARGGIYEVLKFAEDTAIKNGMLTETDDYSILAEDRFKELFGRYSVSVGSTGNLGLSIGIMSAALGFRPTVHMSADARQWKKDMLRAKGAEVVEYQDDYQRAVAEGRKLAESDPMCHFVDDENSADLFLGYSVAARRIRSQFDENGVTVDDDHPLFVYVPCGVGGAPGGIMFGFREVFGKNAHVFFAEPTHAPCMTLGLATGLGHDISVRDIGLDGRTEADGLAVGRPSALVSGIASELVDGCFTVQGEPLFGYLAELADSEGIFVEPSACAGFPGPALISSAKEYLRANGLSDKMKNAAHVVWATGGGMVPEKEMRAYYERGRRVSDQAVTAPGSI